MHALGCTPICINGVIDQAVVDFSASLMDILMELAFGVAARGKRWKDCGAKLIMLAQTLKESPPPPWVDPLLREHSGLESLVNLVSLGCDSEDEKCSFPSLTADPSSLAGTSTSASAVAPSSQVAATASPSSPQGPPDSGMATAAQIPPLQSELEEAHRSLEALRITGRTSTGFFSIGYLTKSLLIICCGLPCRKSKGCARCIWCIRASRYERHHLIARLREGCWSATRQRPCHPWR